MHRVIANAGSGQVIDHVNGIRLDNRRGNLRGCTQAENCRNTRRIRNSTGIRGVIKDSRDNRYGASIRVNDKVYGLGRYATAEEAGRVYDSAARQLHGEFAVLNWPDEPDAYPDVDWVEYAKNRSETAKNQKLSLEKAREIRALLAEGVSTMELSQRYRVTPAVIWQIRNYRSYREPATEQQIKEICQRAEAGQSATRISQELQLGRMMVERIIRDKWGDTPPEKVIKRRSTAKLSLQDVHAILERVEAGEQQKKLAAEYGVSLATVNGYVKGRRRTVG